LLTLYFFAIALHGHVLPRTMSTVRQGRPMKE
jgi:hypothetical protein